MLIVFVVDEMVKNVFFWVSNKDVNIFIFCKIKFIGIIFVYRVKWFFF